MTQSKLRIIFFFAIMLLATAADAKSQPKVLTLYSYHSGYEWVDQMSQSIRRGLHGLDIEYKEFFLDAKRRNKPEQLKESAAQAFSLIKLFQPDIIIGADDPIHKLVLKHFAGKPSPQIVFCGLNADPGVYGYPQDNVTGITERMFIFQAAGLVNHIDPKVTKIACIFDDGATSDMIRAQLVADVEKADTDTLPYQIIAFDQAGTFSEWEKLIREYNHKIDAYIVCLYHTIKKENKEMAVPAKDMLSWTLENTDKPVIGLAEFNVIHGALGAVAGNAEEHGFDAARRTRMLLKGQSASELGISQNKLGRVMLNFHTADRYGFSIPFDVIQSADRIIE